MIKKKNIYWYWKALRKETFAYIIAVPLSLEKSIKDRALAFWFLGNVLFRPIYIMRDQFKN